MAQPSNSNELLSLFGASAHHKFRTFADARVAELHKKLEKATDMDTVARNQGAIEEIRRIALAFKAFSEKK